MHEFYCPHVNLRIVIVERIFEDVKIVERIFEDVKIAERIFESKYLDT